MSETENQSFPTFAALRARHSELLELDAETDGDEKYLADIQSFFDRVRATGAILSAGEERRATQSILNYWATVLYRADRKPSNTTLVDLDPTFKPRLDDTRCPYPGVREFHESESKYFFGRQRTIDYLLARLKEESFLALVGPSGGGKSSFVRAGLLPAIKNIGLEEDHEELQRHFFPIITPSRDPLSNLASLLSAADKSPESLTTEHYREKLQHNSEYLADFLAEIATVAVIVVDQFEELFTLCEDRDARRMFINNLLSLAGTKHRVILCTNMEDFGNAFKRLPEFEKAFERGRTLLPRLGLAELTDAITRPADLVGFKFKDKTVKDIVQEIGTLPVSLPLLQFTLVKLWEKRGEHDEYFSKSGGCRSLLTQSTEEFLQSLEPQERDLAERIFRRMVKFEYKYQARVMPVQLGAHAVAVRLQDLRNDVGPAEQVDAMVERTSNAHLIRRNPSAVPEDSQIELVNESLIQNWPTMAQWVESQKDQRLRTASLSVAALIILAVVGVVFLGVKTVDLIQKYKAHEQASRWARASRKHLNDRRMDTAMLLGVASYLTAPARSTGTIDPLLYGGETDLPARGALLSTLLFRPFPTAFFEHKGTGSIAFSRNGVLASNDRNGTINLQDLDASPYTVFASLPGPRSQTSEAAPLIISNDGRLLISSGVEEREGKSENVITIWEIQSHVGWVGVSVFVGRKTTLSAPDEDPIVALAVSGDNRRLAALSKTALSTKVTTWHLETKKPDKLPMTSEVRSIALSNHGEILATGHSGGKVSLWDTKRRHNDGKPVASCDCLRTRSTITSIAFSPDDKQLAVSGFQEIVLWSGSDDGKFDDRIGGETDQPSKSTLSDNLLTTGSGGTGMTLTFSEDGEMLAGIEGNSRVYLWIMMPEGPKRIAENLFQPITPATNFAFSKDAKTLASRSEQGITMWDLSVPNYLIEHKGDVTDIVFSPSGLFMASSGGKDEAVSLLNILTGEASTISNDDESAALSVAFSHNNKLLAAGLLNGKVLLRNLEDHSTVILESGDKQTLVDFSAVAFRPEAETLVSVTMRGENLHIDEWDVETKNRRDADPQNRPNLAGSLVTAMSLSPDGNFVALATDRRDLLLWDLIRKEVTRHEMLATPIYGLKFSNNGRWLVAGGTDSDTILRYQTSGFDQNPTTIFLEGLSGTIFDLAFSPDDNILAVVVTPLQGDPRNLEARRPGTLVLIDIEKPQVITEALRIHHAAITALAFGPDRLAIGGLDGTVLLTDLATCPAKKRICSVVNRPFTGEETKQHSIPKEYIDLCRESAVERIECR